MNSEPLVCDAQRIERFLQHELSELEQGAFESHLDDCLDCRRVLAARAAGDDVWTRVREALITDSLPPDTPPSTQLPLESPLEEASFSQNAILRLLAPTDNERSLGRLGGYEVMGVIGSGGMGVVLKAFDPALNRNVAIKVLSPHLGDSGAARIRFSREAQAAAVVVHDNVIEIHGVAAAKELNGLPYLVMPYVPGPSLQRRIDDQGPLALVEILRIARQTAMGLAAAHAQGIVHRDVTPANILLADGVERVKLTDFGLARAADDASLTKTGIIAGTPQYMSPEQARGESVDSRSDLFSLGSVLYAMCTGRPPFRAETSYGVLRRITDEQPRHIREINPDIPEWLCRIVSRLMSKQPSDRFGTASEVGDLLEACLAHVQQPTVVPLPPSCDVTGEDPPAFGSAEAGWPWARRRFPLGSIGTIGWLGFLVLLWIGLLGMLLSESPTAPDSDVATERDDHSPREDNFGMMPNDHLPQEDDFFSIPPEALEGMPFAGNAASRAVEPNVKISVPKDAWGDVTRGLRLGVLADPDSVRVGETIPLKLVVENMSDQAIAFSASDVLQQAQADVRHPNKDQVPTSKLGYSGFPRRKRYLLEPGERTVVAEPSLAMVDSKDDGESKPGLTKVILTGIPRMRNHIFFLRYAIRLGKARDPLREDEEPKPEESDSDTDWSGTLTSGTIGVLASRTAQEATGDDVGNGDDDVDGESSAKRLALQAHEKAAAIDRLPRFYIRGHGATVAELTLEEPADDPLENLFQALAKSIADDDWYRYVDLFAWDEEHFVVGTTDSESPRPDFATGKLPPGAFKWGTRQLSGETLRRRGPPRHVLRGSAAVMWDAVLLSNPNYMIATRHEYWWGNNSKQALSPQGGFPPSRARYIALGNEDFFGEESVVVELPTRFEKLWIDPSTGLIRGLLKFRGSNAVVPSLLVRFQDYREIAPGIWWPFREERAQGSLRQGRFSGMRSEYAVDEVRIDVNLAEWIEALKPREGEQVQDQRFGVPLNYEYQANRSLAEILQMADVANQQALESAEEVTRMKAQFDNVVGQQAPTLPADGWIGGTRPDVQGKPYLVHFWATWCGPCKADLPYLQRMTEEGAVIVGVHSTGTSAEEVEKFTNEFGLQWPTYVASLDNRDEAAVSIASYSPPMLPYCILVDAQGKVAAHGLIRSEGDRIMAKFRELRGSRGDNPDNH